jgi:maltose alpha-D-glucosyltransferase/alpha-amylase
LVQTVVGGSGEKVTAIGLRLSAKELIEFLETKRWFGKKSHAARDAEVMDVVPVKWRGVDKPFAVARARVTTDEGTAVYQLFLVDGSEPNDALEDADFRRGLVDAFHEGATFEQHGVRWIVASEGKAPLVVPATAPVTLSSAEQSNSSVVIDREAILKLYRRLEPGIHPDVEVTRFLTIERKFVNVPVLLGTIRFEDSSGGGVTIAGMLQEYVQGAVDGWSYALARLNESDRAVADETQSTLPFVEEAGQLGAVTRAMHEVLASGAPGSDFDMRPATSDDVRRWARGATEMIEKASASLERALKEKRLPKDRIPEAEAIVARRESYVGVTGEIIDGIGSDAGANTRTHGDYHLGQVLRSAAAQFLVIDFEGEPLRSLAERRARHSPLRDVAGMLRSFAYVAAAGGRRQGAGDAWEDSVREAFLNGYFADEKGRGALLPRSESNAMRLLSLFEAEKIFYELQYELDHRPDWVWIPLRGIAGLTL